MWCLWNMNTVFLGDLSGSRELPSEKSTVELDEYDGHDHVDPDAWVTCPFDSNHVMPWKTFQGHVIHCRMVHITKDHRTCPYNFTHILLKEDFDQHLLECTDIPQNSHLVDYGFGPVVVTTDPGAGRKGISGTWLTARPPVPQMLSNAECRICNRKFKTFVDLRAHNSAKHADDESFFLENGNEASTPNHKHAPTPVLPHERETLQATIMQNWVIEAQVWSVGDLCVAKWSFDGQWYRARIESEYSDGRIKVTFMDSKCSEVVRRDTLQQIPNDFMPTTPATTAPSTPSPSYFQSPWPSPIVSPMPPSPVVLRETSQQRSFVHTPTQPAPRPSNATPRARPPSAAATSPSARPPPSSPLWNPSLPPGAPFLQGRPANPRPSTSKSPLIRPMTPGAASPAGSRSSQAETSPSMMYSGRQ